MPEPADWGLTFPNLRDSAAEEQLRQVVGGHLRAELLNADGIEVSNPPFWSAWEQLELIDVEVANPPFWSYLI